MVSDLRVPIPGRVLIDQCRPRRSVTHPRHELFGTRAGRCSERISGVAEIVEAQASDPHCADGTMPRRVQRRCSEGAAGVAGKDEMLRPGHGPGGQVGPRGGHENRWDRDPADTRVGLRRTEHERAVAKLLELVDHHTDRCSTSRLTCRRARSSPTRSAQKVASSTIARERGSIASTIASTCSIVATGRSAGRSTEAPLITQGFRVPPDALDLVARLTAPGRQLARVPPRTTSHGESRATGCGTAVARRAVLLLVHRSRRPEHSL
jgi:hypothetical protein